MRREKKERIKTLLIARLYEYIANGYKIEELRKIAKRLCKFYFPNADEILLEAFSNYAVVLQVKFYDELDLDALIRVYK